MNYQPIQPIVTDEHGTLRFQENAIVRHLLDNGGIDLSQIAALDFPVEDQMQFAMLIGYSLSGAGDLSYFDNATWEAASAMATRGRTEDQARIENMSAQLKALREELRGPIADLYGIHPDDLGAA